MNQILNENRCPYDIAEILEIPISLARKKVDACTTELPGWGPVRKQKNIISRRRSGDGWPREHDLRLHHHRKLHDQGRTTMCQGRDGDFIIQYSIPSATIIPRAVYFFAERGY